MYQLRMSNDFNSILQNFSRSSLVTQDMIVNGGNLSNPKPSGVLEEFVVRVPSRGRYHRTIYLSMLSLRFSVFSHNS